MSDPRVERAMRDLDKHQHLCLYDCEVGDLIVLKREGYTIQDWQFDRAVGSELVREVKGATLSKVQGEVAEWFRLRDKIDSL